MDLVAGNAHACILAVAGDPCLHPGDHLRDRVQPSISEGGRKGDLFGTWLAAGGEWVTIGRYEESTLVYIPSQDSFYYAAPAVMLSQRCPNHTVFIGQFIVEQNATPRVLVHDLLRMQGVSFVNMPPRERYACLQQMQGCLGPICMLQWVGDCKVLADELRSGRFKIPHEVKSVVALSSAPGKVSMVSL